VARDLYEMGVRAGERALGEEFFTEEVGNFWGILETRPYMRAREGLANALWALGERDQALAHYREMLELNPVDNQGVRYELADCLLEERLPPRSCRKPRMPTLMYRYTSWEGRTCWRKDYPS
jgi:tetratricopeptide (TPR) repeat protein